MNNNIELELRAEVSSQKFEELLMKLKKSNTLVSHTKRLSVMFFGAINKFNIDVRIRIDSNKNAELVLKKGALHTHDRIESSQSIRKEQILGFIKIFSLLDLNSKVTERENFVFDLKNEISLVLVKADKISYVEIEKMSNLNTIEENKENLLRILADFELKQIKDDVEFNELCDRLTKYSDWVFTNSEKDLEKIDTMLKNY